MQRILGIALAALSTAGAQQPIRVDGSTGVMPLVTALAAEYHKTRPGAISFGTGLGSSARIEAVKAGRIDVALASHGIVVPDLEKQGLVVRKIADLPVVFATHASSGVTEISESQACDIYSGRLTNWRQLGGADLPIVAATRPKGEVDGDVVTAGVPCMSALTPHATVAVKDKPEEMAEFLSTTRGAFGMTTTAVVGQSGGRMTALSLGGIVASPANVAAGRYRLTRPSYLVIRRENSPALDEFLRFIQSEAGARIIRANSAIPAR